jgi:hypothetical protein
MKPNQYARRIELIDFMIYPLSDARVQINFVVWNWNWEARLKSDRMFSECLLITKLYAPNRNININCFFLMFELIAFQIGFYKSRTVEWRSMGYILFS